MGKNKAADDASPAGKKAKNEADAPEPVAKAVPVTPPKAAQVATPKVRRCITGDVLSAELGGTNMDGTYLPFPLKFVGKLIDKACRPPYDKEDLPFKNRIQGKFCIKRGALALVEDEAAKLPAPDPVQAAAAVAANAAVVESKGTTKTAASPAVKKPTSPLYHKLEGRRRERVAREAAKAEAEAAKAAAEAEAAKAAAAATEADDDDDDDGGSDNGGSNDDAGGSSGGAKTGGKDSDDDGGSDGGDGSGPGEESGSGGEDDGDEDNDEDREDD